MTINFPTTQGNPQSLDIAVSSANSIIGNSARDDLDSTINKVNTTFQDVYENYNNKFVGGGTITLNSTGTTLTFGERLDFVYNNAGTEQTIQSIVAAAGTLTFSSSGTLAYITVTKGSPGTAVLTSNATSLPAASASTEVFLLAYRRDDLNGTQRIYFGYGTGGSIAVNGTSTWGGSSSGSGSGQKNYLSTSTSTAAGWTASSSAITVATTTTNTPRPVTTGTGIQFTGVSGSTAYAYARFTLDPADYNTKLQLQFAQNFITGYTSGNFQVSVYSNTASNYGGTYTRLPLSTDSSSISALPALEGTYKTSFDAPGSAQQYIEVRIGLNGSFTSSIVLSDIVVGPGTVIQGAAVTPWQSYTFSVTGLGSGSTSSTAGQYRRVGDTLECQFNFVESATAGTGSTQISIGIPSGYTINTSALSGALAYINLGYFQGNNLSGYMTYNSSPSNVYFVNGASGAFLLGSNVASTSEFQGRFTVPVNELAGSGTLNVVQNDLQYYYTTSAWGTTNTSASTSQGQGGVAGGSTTPSGTYFQYIFTPTTPVPVGAKPVVELSGDGIHWSATSSPQVGTSGLTVESLRNDGTNYIGAGVTLTNSGQFQVYFGKYPTGSAGSSLWSGLGTWYWRVTVGLPGQAVGFGIAVPGQSAGLISAAGVPGNTTGSAIASGYVGQQITANLGSPVSFNTSPTTLITMSIPAGIWMISGQVESLPTTTPGTTAINSAGISNANNAYDSVSFLNSSYFAAIATRQMIASPVRYVNLSTATNYYLTASIGGTSPSGTWGVNTFMQAVRIA